jgi:hypothetical protein
VPYEWGRLARVVVVTAGIVLVGEFLVATEGAAGFALRVALWLLYPLLLFLGGFFSAEERRWLTLLISDPGEVVGRLRAVTERPAAVPGEVPEAYEAELRDDDAIP